MSKQGKLFFKDFNIFHVVAKGRMLKTFIKRQKVQLLNMPPLFFFIYFIPRNTNVVRIRTWQQILPLDSINNEKYEFL